MIAHRQEIRNLEIMAKSQYKVFEGWGDMGAEITERELAGLREDVKALKRTYGGTNYSPAENYNGVKDIIIPIEPSDYDAGCYDCIVIGVLVSRQFTNTAFINYERKAVHESDIPFFK